MLRRAIVPLRRCVATATCAARMKSTLEIARMLPKTELHLHLDGSLRASFMEARARARGVELPVPAGNIGDYVRGRERGTMAKSLSIFEMFGRFLQMEDELVIATRNLCDDLVADGVAYAEVRFCPLTCCNEGLTPERAAKAVQQALHDHALPARLVVCAMRSGSAEDSLQLAHLARQLDAAFDLAGNEEDFPLSLHERALRFCAAEGVPLVPHAGEWPGSVSNIEYALGFSTLRRIGHGVELAGQPELQRQLRDRGITVECCMTSNVGGKKAKSFVEHPIRELFHAGVPVSLNSDNLMASGSLAVGAATSSCELARLVDNVGFSWPEAVRVLRMGYDAALCDDATRAALHSKLDAAVAELGLGGP